MAQHIPKENGLDNSINVLREGYMYIPNRRHSFHSDIFETRILGQKAICIGGKEAAALFYDNEKFKRHGAAPKRVQKTLFGEKGVQTLDGEQHRHRKEMFMSLMTRERLDVLKQIAEKQWDIAINNWEKESHITLYEASKELMARIACEWAGVPIWAKELKQRAQDLGALIESASAIGPKYWAGKQARNRTEKWLSGLITQVRNKELFAPEDSALYTMSWHRDLNGNLMDTSIAAVELVNILRPIVAISVYINFTALALHQFPQEVERLKEKDHDYGRMFVQEVRRYYPFFPFTPARVKSDFTWKGYQFKKETLTLLDLYGTNHDPEIWDNPDIFHPERFVEWKGSPFDFIPQGGGDYFAGHRCAGEWVTIQMMQVALDFMINKMDYEIPQQDTSFSMVKMPSTSRSGFVIKGVRKI